MVSIICTQRIRCLCNSPIPQFRAADVPCSLPQHPSHSNTYYNNNPSATPPTTASSAPDIDARLSPAESAVDGPEVLPVSEPKGDESGLSLLVGRGPPAPEEVAVAIVVCAEDPDDELVLEVEEDADVEDDDVVPDIVPKPMRC
jgi:hypothetical protein